MADLKYFSGVPEVGIVPRTYHLYVPNFGGLEPARVLRSVELMARHVLPAFR